MKMFILKLIGPPLIKLIEAFLEYRNRNNVEMPIQVRRYAQKAYMIPRGYVFKFDGKLYVSIQAAIVKPNNKFQYITLRPAPWYVYTKGYVRLGFFKVCKFLFRQWDKLTVLFLKFFSVRPKSVQVNG